MNYRYGGEDTEFNIKCLQHVNKMVMNEKMYYSWYLRKNHSTTAKRNINFCYTMMEVAGKEYKLLNENCQDNLKLWEIYQADYKKLILDYSTRLPEKEKAIVDNRMEKKYWWLNIEV